MIEFLSQFAHWSGLSIVGVMGWLIAIERRKVSVDHRLEALEQGHDDAHSAIMGKLDRVVADVTVLKTDVAYIRGRESGRNSRD